MLAEYETALKCSLDNAPQMIIDLTEDDLCELEPALKRNKKERMFVASSLTTPPTMMTIIDEAVTSS